MPRYILINGAPRSGKDTIAKNFICRYPKNAIFERFSRPHKEAFAAMTKADIEEWFNVLPYENDKTAVIPWLGVSYRQWQIDFSEKFMKPLYGDDIFGRMLLERTRHFYDHVPVIVPDCGFQVEVDTFAAADCLLIRVERKGTSFEGDSRSHVEPCGGWSFITLHNNGTQDEIERASFAYINSWLETPR